MTAKTRETLPKGCLTFVVCLNTSSSRKNLHSEMGQCIVHADSTIQVLISVDKTVKHFLQWPLQVFIVFLFTSDVCLVTVLI